MESLTNCQANRTRVAMRTVKRDTAGPGMKSLTYCQPNRTNNEDTENEFSWMWYEITHNLSNHQYQIEVEKNEKEDTFISNEITHSLSSQQYQNCINKKVTATLSIRY